MNSKVKNPALRKILEGRKVENVSKRRDPNGLTYETWDSRYAQK